jgi:hypothetical protein
MYNRNFTLFANYSLGFSNGDSDGSGSFPAYSYDLSDEYGRSSFDIRHNFIIGGSFNIPWGISLNPFIIANTGRPFNITRGLDLNGDALFNERPTFGELGARCSELGLTASYCDVSGQDPNAILPRNYGEGPKFFSVNLRVGKNFGLGGRLSRLWPRMAARARASVAAVVAAVAVVAVGGGAAAAAEAAEAAARRWRRRRRHDDDGTGRRRGSQAL